MRTQQLMRLIDRALACAGLYTIGDERKYSLEIKENIIVNELQLTDNILRQIEGGLMSRTEAIAKLRGIKEMEADDVIKVIDAERAKDTLAQQELMGGLMGDNEEQQGSNDPLNPKDDKTKDGDKD